ncbi:MAG TPA: metallophosphoesterase, partial [Tenuifilaceae bacterium]|nr:metallophosphoesterase [Tenuifilaceae bacterium]
IRPEFVLLTGDLINEGELEDFECRRNHTRAIEMLKKFEVPVYLVPGNHDLGGWTAAPPPQGTSRKEWWRFFGWRQPQIPPTRAEYYTHDYSFDYGNIHFTGLEAYDNYDSYMYDVYGAESFIPSQITWLQNDLAAAGSKKKVLFYHYDFKSELNLTALGVDMALWGHKHFDIGSITTTPYNIATAAVCDSTRAFRVIRVNNGTLQPQSTTRTHSNGDMLTINFNTANNGSLDFVSATINNKYSQSFSNGLVKFIMPLSQYGYSVTNGTLEQVLESETTATCYVCVSIPTGDIVTTSITKLNNPTGIEDIKRNNLNISIYPNPFNNEVKIDFNLSKEDNINISIYNINGQLVKTLLNKKMLPGKYTAKWDGTNNTNQIVEYGVYIYRLTLNEKTTDSGQIVFSK